MSPHEPPLGSVKELPVPILLPRFSFLSKVAEQSQPGEPCQRSPLKGAVTLKLCMDGVLDSGTGCIQGVHLGGRAGEMHHDLSFSC